MIAAPRVLILVLAALFSLYHIVLGVDSLGIPDSPWPALAAIVLYAAASALSLWPAQHAEQAQPTAPSQHSQHSQSAQQSQQARMPVWLAVANILVGILITALVFSQLDPGKANGYATWSVAAFATLMVITAVRRRPIYAWVGIGALAAGVTVWAGPLALTTMGVVGGAVWVGVAHALSVALAAGLRDAREYKAAGQSAEQWQVGREAMLFEHRGLLLQMNRLAAPMLRVIALNDGQLTDEQRRECLLLEATIRDEIRGRRLLSKEVRVEIMAARRRGIDVALLDDGGLDDLGEPELALVLHELAGEVRSSAADRLVIRTGAARSEIAVTVVGLTAVGDGMASALGWAADREADPEAIEDQLDVWREIPRPPAHS